MIYPPQIDAQATEYLRKVRSDRQAMALTTANTTPVRAPRRSVAIFVAGAILGSLVVAAVGRHDRSRSTLESKSSEVRPAVTTRLEAEFVAEFGSRPSPRRTYSAAGAPAEPGPSDENRTGGGSRLGRAGAGPAEFEHRLSEE